MASSAQNNLFLSSLKFIAKDVIGDVLYFPVWWYSRGLKKTAVNLWNSLLRAINNFALPILVKSLFKPMYGDYSKSGRIISFFMRIIHLIALTVGVAIWAVVLLALLLAWIALPLFIVYNIFFQLFGPF